MDKKNLSENILKCLECGGDIEEHHRRDIEKIYKEFKLIKVKKCRYCFNCYRQSIIITYIKEEISKRLYIKIIEFISELKEEILNRLHNKGYFYVNGYEKVDNKKIYDFFEKLNYSISKFEDKIDDLIREERLI